MTDYELYSLIATTFSALIVATTLLVAAYQVKQLISQHRDNHDWNRRIETQKAIDEIRSIDTQKLNDVFGYKYRKEPMPLEEINKSFENDWHLEHQCLRLLNAYEGLAAGVKLGIYDEDVIIVNRKGNMERTYIKFKNYIEHRRHNTKRSTYMEYQRLIDKWDEDEQNTGSKIPIAKHE